MTGYIDLTNEVFAPLSDETWEAMRGADASLVRGEAANDPVVAALEHRIAELTGHAAGILLPSSTVATRLFLSSLESPGSRVILEARSHLMWMQQQVIARHGRMTAAAITGDHRGVIPVDEVFAAHGTEVLGQRIPTGLLALENTHNVCGGTFLTPGQTAGYGEAAAAIGAELFIDGARIFDAAVAQGVAVRDLTAPADAVVVALTKAPGAPFGAVLTGSQTRIDRVRAEATSDGTLHVHRRGPFAAAAMQLLDSVEERVARAHAHARHFAQLLDAHSKLRVTRPETNIVRVDLPSDIEARRLAETLEAQGVGSRVIEAHALRFIPHAALTLEQLEAAAQRINVAFDASQTDEQSESPTAQRSS